MSEHANHCLPRGVAQGPRTRPPSPAVALLARAPLEHRLALVGVCDVAGPEKPTESGPTAGRSEARADFCFASATRRRELSPSIVMILAWWPTRSISAVAVAAFGKMAGHSLNGRFVVRIS